jgi:hypothetical protein
MSVNRARALQVYDPVLTNIARSYRPKGFIESQVLPSIPISLLGGIYPIFDEAYWFGAEVDAEIRDRSPAKEVDFSWSTDPYLAKEYALKVSITELEELQAEPILRLRQNKTTFLSTRMQLLREIRAAALLETIANGGGITSANAATPGTNWDISTATIEADIKTGVLAIYDAIGQAPNKMIIPFKVAYAMAVNPTIRAQLQYQITGRTENANFLEVGGRVLPSVIHGMEVVIPVGAQKNTAREGAAKAITEIWGDDVRLLFANPGAEWGEPTVAYKLVHTAPRVTRWNQVDPDVEYVREMERVAEKVVAPDAGYLLHDLLT